MLVELDAEWREPAERIAANRGVVLADAGGERDDVGVAKQHHVGADVLAQPVNVDLVGQLRVGVAGFDETVELPEVDLAPETRTPERRFSIVSMSAMVMPAVRFRYMMTPGSTSPDRVPITRPSIGVSPIDVSCGRPPTIADADAPLPRCSTI